MVDVRSWVLLGVFWAACASVVAAQDDPFAIDTSGIGKIKLQKKHIRIVIVAFVLFSMILYAVQTMGWGLLEMSGGFLAVGVCTIIICGMTGDEAMAAFIKGLSLMIVPALIVGIARGIQVVMVEGEIIDTILNHAAGVLQEQPKWIAAQGMFVFQSTLNFFIPSASGQALGDGDRHHLGVSHGELRRGHH